MQVRLKQGSDCLKGRHLQKNVHVHAQDMSGTVPQAELPWCLVAGVHRTCACCPAMLVFIE